MVNAKLNRALMAALLTAATAATAAVAGCADEAPRGGGGGPAIGAALKPEGRDFAEAYARMPWVHADLAAGDWKRAGDDLAFVRGKLEALAGAPEIDPAFNERVQALKPAIDTLAAAIDKHDAAAMKGAVSVLGQFASVTNDPGVLGR